jgi:hypothetical protein
MSHWLDEPRYQHEVLNVRTLWVTIALSLLVHFAALFLWLPRTPPPGPPGEGQDLANERLQVRLEAIPKPAPVQTPERPNEIVASVRPLARPPRATLRTRPPPVLVAPAPAAPAIPTPPPATPPLAMPPVPAPPRTSPPVEGDLWSYIQARRRERGEVEAPPVAIARVDPNAGLAANLPAPATGIGAQEAKKGGGIFEIRRMEYDNAAFEFFGWNKEMGRRTPQLIEVRKGNNSDMRIAVVRKMIAIIREHSKEDFVWHSPRRDDDLVLSARLSDNAALENFLMHEFFDDPRRAQ